MNQTTTLHKTRSLTEAKSQTNLELNRIGVTMFSLTAGIAGCWAVACLFSGIIASNGITGLVSNFASAFAS